MNAKVMLSPWILSGCAHLGWCEEPLPQPSSTHSERYVAHNAFDDNPATRWASAPSGKREYLEIDLGESVAIGSIASAR